MEVAEGRDACIICRIKHHYKSKQSKTSTVQSDATFNRMLDAARRKKRDDIVKWMEGKKYTTTVVKYHNKCYALLKKPPPKRVPHPQKRYLQMLTDIFIIPRLQEKQEIWPLEKLKKAYRRMAFEYEGVRLKTNRSFLDRLKIHFPGMKFSFIREEWKTVELVYFGRDDIDTSELEATEVGSCSSDSDSENDYDSDSGGSDENNDEEPDGPHFSLRGGSKQPSVSQTQESAEKNTPSGRLESDKPRKTGGRGGLNAAQMPQTWDYRADPCSGPKEDEEWLPHRVTKVEEMREKTKAAKQTLSLQCVCQGRMQTHKRVLPFTEWRWQKIWSLRDSWDGMEGPERDVMMGLTWEDKTLSGYHACCYAYLCGKRHRALVKKRIEKRQGTYVPPVKKVECVVLPSRLRSQRAAKATEKESETTEPSGTEDFEMKTVHVDKECCVVLNRTDLSPAPTEENEECNASGNIYQRKTQKRKLLGNTNDSSLAKAGRPKHKENEEIPFAMEVQVVDHKDRKHDPDPQAIDNRDSTNNPDPPVSLSCEEKGSEQLGTEPVKALQCERGSVHETLPRESKLQASLEITCSKTERNLPLKSKEGRVPQAEKTEREIRTAQCSEACAITGEVKVEVHDDVEGRVPQAEKTEREIRTAQCSEACAITGEVKVEVHDDVEPKGSGTTGVSDFLSAKSVESRFVSSYEENSEDKDCEKGIIVKEENA